MPDLIEDERLASLFGTFRAEAGAEIRAPGSQTARRTVRRRRFTRMTGVAAVAIAGLVAVGVAAMPGQGGHTDSGDPPALGPTLSSEELERLGVEALATMGYAPPGAPAGPGLRPVPPGTVFGGVVADQSIFRLGSSAEPLPPGAYELEGFCLHQGLVTVDWRVPEGPSGVLVLDCWADPGQSTSVTVGASGVIDLTITGEVWARDRAGFAIVLTDPRVVIASNALSPTPSPVIFERRRMLQEGPMMFQGPWQGAGSYELTAACAGSGTVEVTLAAGTATASRTLACTAAGALTTVTVQPTSGATMSVSLEPDEAATNAAAVAFRVTSR